MLRGLTIAGLLTLLILSGISCVWTIPSPSVPEASSGGGAKTGDVASVPSTPAADLASTDAGATPVQPLTLPPDGPVSAGGPRLAAVLPTMASRSHFLLDYKVEGARSLVERVELWVTSDAGMNWRLHAYDSDCESPFEIALEDGEWGLWWVVTTARGRGAYPGPGDPPPDSISIDTQPPTISFAEARVWAETRGVVGERVGIELPFQVDDPHLDFRSIRCESRVGDGPWRLVDTPDGIARIDIPMGPDPVRIRVSARDRFRHSGSLEKVILPSDRLHPPRIAFVDPPQMWVGGGSSVQLSWEGSWPSTPDATAVIEFSVDGVDWRPVASGLPTTGTRSWLAPRQGTVSGQLRVRLVGSAMREDSPVDAIPLRIDAVPPVARLLAPIAGEGMRIPLLVDAGDSGGSDLATLELWRHTDGQWRLFGSFDPGVSIPFDPPSAGNHSLWLVARDGGGLESEPPPTDPSLAFQFTSRGDERQIGLLSFRDGGVFPAGGRHLVFFEYLGETKETTIVHLEWSPDDGRTWSRRSSGPAHTGRLDLILPRADVAAARVRVVAEDVSGRRSEDRSPRSFRVLAEAPDLTVTAVIPTTNGGSVVHFRAAGDRIDTLEKIVLYHRQGEGRWERWPSFFAPESPLRVNLPATTSFKLTGVDRPGNVTLGPHAGSFPWVDSEPQGRVVPGKLSMLTEGGRTVVGGSSHYIFWRTEGQGPSPTARLEQRIGKTGTWFEVGRDLPGTGRTLWTSPEQDGAEVWLRLVTPGVAGDVVAQIAAPFTVDDRTPRALFTGPTTSRGRITEFEIKVPSEEDVESIEVWIRNVSTPVWRQVAEARAGKPIQAELVDGLYHVSAVAVDGAGNRSHRPVAGAKGQGTLMVDTVPPILQVYESEVRKRLFRRGGSLVIRPRVHDANLSAFPVSFQVIEDGSSRPVALKSYHPNATDFEWILPAKAGVHTLELIAEDLAGNRAIQRIPVTVIPTPPRPMILTDFAERVFAAGDEVSIEWETEGVEPDWSRLQVQFAEDGEKFQVIYDAQPADGSVVWRVPAVDSNRCRLRVVIVAPDGLRGESSTGRFTASSSPPRVRAGGIRPAGGS